MIEERGTVLSLKQGNTAVLAAKKTDACDSCGSKALCKGMSETDMTIEATNDIGAKPGDTVVFTMPEGAVIKAGVLVYLVPLIGFIIGVVIAQLATPRLLPSMNADAASAVLGFALMAAAYFGVSVYSKRHSAAIEMPRIIRIE